jgi:predicted enzyme related to lactoylglutathione lyase
MINQQTVLKSDFQGNLSRSVWFDLPAANLADAMSFYEGLLGWTFQRMEESPLTDYVMIDVGGKLIGGIRLTSSPVRRADTSAPILYFTVDKLAPKVARAKELGAEIVGQTVDLGKGRGCYQWIRDREGNLIGLWAPK